VLGLAAALEIVFHLRHAALGDSEMTLYWTTFDSHSVAPLAIAVIAAVGGFWLAKRTAPGMAEAYHAANTPRGGSA